MHARHFNFRVYRIQEKRNRIKRSSSTPSTDQSQHRPDLFFTGWNKMDTGNQKILGVSKKEIFSGKCINLYSLH
ncbi:unnamed protein product [Trichobilharzia regenti]|nr:unnamed protein product [Trichobilharzia regenti]